MGMERRRRRRDRGTEQVPEVVVEMEVEVPEVEEVEEEPTHTPARKSRLERRGKREVIKAEDPADQPEAAPAMFDLEQLEVGKAYTITRTSVGEWVVAVTNGVVGVGAVAGKRRTKSEYEAIVYTQDYVDWYDEWNKLSYDAKVKKAKKAGVKWESHSDSKIDNMRMTAAYRDQLGIEKYKPEYQSADSRKAVR